MNFHEEFNEFLKKAVFEALVDYLKNKSNILIFISETNLTPKIYISYSEITEYINKKYDKKISLINYEFNYSTFDYCYNDLLLIKSSLRDFLNETGIPFSNINVSKLTNEMQELQEQLNVYNTFLENLPLEFC